MEDTETEDFSKYHIHPNDIQEAVKAFKYTDKQRTGHVLVEDLPKIYENLGLRLSSTEIAVLLLESGLEDTKKETISMYEFLRATLKKVHKMNIEEELMTAFKFYDMDNNGYISREELMFLINNVMKLRIDPVRVDDMISRADTDGSGNISYKEFVKLMVDPL